MTAADYRAHARTAFNSYNASDPVETKSLAVLRAIYFRLVAIDLAQDDASAAIAGALTATTAPVQDVVPSKDDAVAKKATPPRKRAARKPTTPKETTT